MPVIAIGAAVVADVVAGSAIAATVGGIAAISAVTAFEVVAAVGATVGAIGAVTGNKALSMVGTIVGAIGGIGGLASSAGLLGEAAASSAPIFGPAPAAAAAETTPTLAGMAADNPGIGAGGATTAGAGPLGSAGGAASAADSASTGAIDFVAGGGAPGEVATPSDLHLMATTAENVTDPAATLANTIQPSTTAATDTTNSILNGGAGLPAAPAVPGLSGPGTTQWPTAETFANNPSLPTDTPVPPKAPGNLGATDPVTGETTTMGVDPSGKLVSMPDNESSNGLFGSLLDFAKKNPVAALGAIQAGGSFLSGATSTLTPAQVSAYNAQAAANNAAAALANQQRANLAMPKAVASSAPVTGAPAQLVPQMATPGIINQAPRPTVTGVPA